MAEILIAPKALPTRRSKFTEDLPEARKPVEAQKAPTRFSIPRKPVPNRQSRSQEDLPEAKKPVGAQKEPTVDLSETSPSRAQVSAFSADSSAAEISLRESSAPPSTSPLNSLRRPSASSGAQTRATPSISSAASSLSEASIFSTGDSTAGSITSESSAPPSASRSPSPLQSLRRKYNAVFSSGQASKSNETQKIDSASVYSITQVHAFEDLCATLSRRVDGANECAKFQSWHSKTVGAMAGAALGLALAVGSLSFAPFIGASNFYKNTIDFLKDVVIRTNPNAAELKKDKNDFFNGLNATLRTAESDPLIMAHLNSQNDFQPQVRNVLKYFKRQ